MLESCSPTKIKIVGLSPVKSVPEAREDLLKRLEAVRYEYLEYLIYEGIENRGNAQTDMIVEFNP